MNNLEKKDKLQNKLKKALEGAISDFYKNDGDLVQLEGTERACVFRIGIYLHERMQKDDELKELSLDCEYNKNGIIPKKLNGSNVQPDLIIHQRKSNNSNTVVIEFKGWWNEGRDDIKKLKQFTLPPYNYHLAVFVRLGKTKRDTIYRIL